tara:strand:- start:376 stop:723 length:348 start_codon:yes stop_codon:yes gene_type:complete
MNDIAQHTMDTIYYHKQKYAKLKHESLAKDDVITRLKQDIVDLQDKLKYQQKFVCGWSEEDVHHLASSMGVKITAEEADEIIHHVESAFDATVGVSWDTIEWAIDDHVERREERT